MKYVIAEYEQYLFFKSMSNPKTISAKNYEDAARQVLAGLPEGKRVLVRREGGNYRTKKFAIVRGYVYRIPKSAF